MTLRRLMRAVPRLPKRDACLSGGKPSSSLSEGWARGTLGRMAEGQEYIEQARAVGQRLGFRNVQSKAETHLASGLPDNQPVTLLGGIPKTFKLLTVELTAQRAREIIIDGMFAPTKPALPCQPVRFHGGCATS